MPMIDERARELNIKITYHGPGLSGSTTNLQYLYNKTRPEQKSKMSVLRTETSSSLWFVLRPLSLGEFEGLRICFHLYCSPGCQFIAGAKEEVLANSDGVVFVVDSQDARKDASIWAREQLEACIASQGRRLADMPLTLQYNKRDLPNALPVDVLDATHNTYRRPAFAAVAPTGEGVFDTLKDIALQVLGRLRAGTL